VRGDRSVRHRARTAGAVPRAGVNTAEVTEPLRRSHGRAQRSRSLEAGRGAPCCWPTAAVVSDTEPETVAKLFKALSDPVRIRLVSLIRHSPGGEACFCDLAEDFDMPQPSLSHHLRALVSAGLLARERRSTWSWYSLIPESLETLGGACFAKAARSLTGQRQ
jgi:DNA-binding transcriptional ArsR family regulator